MKLILPLSIELPRKKVQNKRFPLNLNHFRNAHHTEMNQAKKIYKEVVRKLLRGQGVDELPQRYSKVRLTYTLYPYSKRRMDLGNILAAVQKFTDDALVECNVLEDDDYKVVNEINYRFGKVDTKNPRAELLLEEI